MDKKLTKSRPPKKSKGYVLMAATGEAGTKAVPVSEFIKEYLLTDEIANYILDKYNLINSGVKEIKIIAIEQFINKQFRSFFDVVSFNSVNLPMIWCRGKRYTKDKIEPFVLIMSPYYDAVVLHNDVTDSYTAPQTIMFEGVSWYVNVMEYINVGDVKRANIPPIRVEENESWLDIAKKLYSIAEVQYD